MYTFIIIKKWLEFRSMIKQKIVKMRNFLIENFNKTKIPPLETPVFWIRILFDLLKMA